MLLSDSEILRQYEDGLIGVTPWDETLVNPSSLDVRLNRQFRRMRQDLPLLDFADVQPGYTDPHECDSFIMRPGEFVLASTLEVVRLPGDLAARVEGKSSIGRLGLIVHATAGFIDPGFEGDITLELYNAFPTPIRIHAGMRIGQLAFERMSQIPDRDYSKTGHYQGQRGPTESRYKI